MTHLLHCVSVTLYLSLSVSLYLESLLQVAQLRRTASAADTDWQYHGEQMAGIRFYGTTGLPTAEQGFAYWESDESSEPADVLLIRNDGSRIRSKGMPVFSQPTAEDH